MIRACVGHQMAVRIVTVCVEARVGIERMSLAINDHVTIPNRPDGGYGRLLNQVGNLVGASEATQLRRALLRGSMCCAAFLTML
jgi:hypothetical protein